MAVWHYGFRMAWKVDPATVLLCTVEKQNRVHHRLRPASWTGTLQE